MSPDRISLLAPAKINLYLKITGRRQDGYHYLASLMQKISLYDQLDIELSGKPGISLNCPGSDLPEDEANLAFRAASLFLEELPERGKKDIPGITIALRKGIPTAAGLGGGSSDAAAILRGLNVLFSTVFQDKQLLEMGLSLGADVPFFVTEYPVAWATGIGEKLQPAVPLNGYRIPLVNPGYSVSTPWVYENFALTVGENINNLKDFKKPDQFDGQHIFLKRAIEPRELVNDLEQVTANSYPEIEQLKKSLVKGGAIAAMMSGSGPTVFGLFQESDAERAAACAQELKRKYQNTFLVDPLQD